MTIDNASKTWKKLSKIKASGTLNQKAIVMFPRIQVKKKKYVKALEEYQGNLLLVGVNYNKESKKHQCVIEEVLI